MAGRTEQPCGIEEEEEEEVSYVRTCSLWDKCRLPPRLSSFFLSSSSSSFPIWVGFIGGVGMRTGERGATLLSFLLRLSRTSFWLCADVTLLPSPPFALLSFF